MLTFSHSPLMGFPIEPALRIHAEHFRAPTLNARMTPAYPFSQSPEAIQRQAEDAALLIKLAEGDTQALAQLYDRYHRPLYALARRILNDSAEAEDILHDVFLSLWQNATSYDTARGSLFTWAATLTRNRSIDRLRRRTHRQELLDQAHPSDLSPAATQPENNSADTLADREKTATVRAALASLGTEQSQPIELAYFQGLTHEEIAARLKQPLGTIKARIRRGLLKLRDTLAAQL